MRPHDRKPCSVAGIVYLKLTGKVQQLIQGLSTNPDFDRAGSIECTAFRLNIVTPRDRGTGLSTGRRYYEPITFVKNFDQATPAIAKALVENEAIETAEFRFFDMVNGVEKLVYTILTEGGGISSQRQFVSDTVDPALAARPPQEEVGLVFQKISWTWDDPPVVAHDTWGSGTQ